MKLTQGDNLGDPTGDLAEESTPDKSRWVALHWNSVYKLLYRLSGGNGHEAEDLAQETFLKAIERSGSFAAGSNLRAWLLRIATNAFLDRQRRRKVMKIASLSPEAAQVDGQVAPPGKELETGELHASLLRALETLPETARTVFLLRASEELSFRQIADAIGTTEETARWHMMQARKALLAKLGPKLD